MFDVSRFKVQILVLALVLVLAAFPSDVLAQSAGASSAQLAALVVQYDSAWNHRDTITVSRLLAPGYQYFTSRGEVRSRAEMMAFLADPEYRLASAERSEMVVTMSGPVAVVSSRWRGHGTYRRERFTDDQRCGLVWQQARRTWRLLHEHCVQIAGTVPIPSN